MQPPFNANVIPSEVQALAPKTLFKEPSEVLISALGEPKVVLAFESNAV